MDRLGALKQFFREFVGGRAVAADKAEVAVSLFEALLSASHQPTAVEIFEAEKMHLEKLLPLGGHFEPVFGLMDG